MIGFIKSALDSIKGLRNKIKEKRDDLVAGFLRKYNEFEFKLSDIFDEGYNESSVPMKILKSIGRPLSYFFSKIVIYFIPTIAVSLLIGILNIILLVTSIVIIVITFPFNLIHKIIISFKENGKAGLIGMASLLVPGSGQFKNGQKHKGIFFITIFAVFLLWELSTGRYFQYFSEISEYPGGSFLRDYGGIFGKGLWGLVTLGKYILYMPYRGIFLEVASLDKPWMSADNSYVLLGNGIISLAFFSVYAAIAVFACKDAYSSRIKLDNGERLQTWAEAKKTFFNDFFAYIIVIPAALFLLMFTIIPFLFSFLVAFTNFESLQSPNFPIQLMRWTGLKTFNEVFTNSDLLFYFVDVLKWTVIYAFFASITVYILGFIHALVIESKYVKFKRFFRVFLIIPWAVPAMVSLMAFKFVFDADGLINNLLIQQGWMDGAQEFLYNIGLMGVEPGKFNRISFFTAPENYKMARLGIILVNLWLGAPYFMMLTTGVLGTIPNSLYEASEIDGATKGQQFRHITMPWVLRGTLPVIISTFTFNFNNFGAIYFLTGGGPGQVTDSIPISLLGSPLVPGQTDILISWIYKISFSGTNSIYNIASAYSILIFIFIASFAIWNLSRVKSFWEED